MHTGRKSRSTLPKRLPLRQVWQWPRCHCEDEEDNEAQPHYHIKTQQPEFKHNSSASCQSNKSETPSSTVPSTRDGTWHWMDSALDASNDPGWMASPLESEIAAANAEIEVESQIIILRSNHEATKWRLVTFVLLVLTLSEATVLVLGGFRC